MIQESKRNCKCRTNSHASASYPANVVAIKSNSSDVTAVIHASVDGVFMEAKNNFRRKKLRRPKSKVQYS